MNNMNDILKRIRDSRNPIYASAVILNLNGIALEVAFAFTEEIETEKFKIEFCLQ